MQYTCVPLLLIPYSTPHSLSFHASWLDWSSWTTCSDSCGSCGIRTRTRVCLSTVPSCTCQGEGLGVEYCNLSVCRYPRQSCCNSMRVTTVNGIFACQTTSSLST